MKVALMQPYFFPYIGYFQLIHSVDEFVVFDNAQYIRRGWMNRNRILNENKESIFINVPIIKAPREMKIKDIVISNNYNWQRKIFDQLEYYRKAPYYKETLDLLEESLTTDVQYLCQLNISVLKRLCELLGIDTKITIMSERFPFVQKTNAADEWGIEVSKAINATTYINAIGGKDIYNQQKYNDYGLKIQFLKPILTPYKQFNNTFVPGLSIIDVLMFNDITITKNMLDMHELIKL